MEYRSVVERDSRTEGVSFVLRRVSFGRRMELMRQIRELARRGAFLEAGSGADDKMDAAIVSAEIDRLYLSWGLVEVRGLEIDGQAATPQMLAELGPEELVREAVELVKAECGLSETERKN